MTDQQTRAESIPTGRTGPTDQPVDPDASSHPRVAVERLSKFYGEKRVLNDVSIDVQPHEVVSLIGASGSGKSTLLRCVADLVAFEYGEIRLDGRSIHDPAFGARGVHKHIGIVFQSYNLFPHMNVMDNITLAPCRVHGVDKHAARSEASRLLELFGLEGFAESYPEQLSGGQQQRVAVVRALATNPEVLLLDEVTAALDPELIGEVLKIVRDLKAQGMTMLIVTHEMGFARDVSDRVCFLDGGQVVEEAPPNELFANPKHERTQQFLQRIIEAGRL